MPRTLVEARVLMALAVAAGVDSGGLHVFPVRSDQVFLTVIEARRPDVFHVLTYGYALLWFSTAFWIASLIGSLVTIVVYRAAPTARFRGLPPYPHPETRPALSLVLGEAHYPTRPGRAPQPAWLTTPQRGLYTGVMVLGAVGTGTRHYPQRLLRQIGRLCKVPVRTRVLPLMQDNSMQVTVRGVLVTRQVGPFVLRREFRRACEVTPNTILTADI